MPSTTNILAFILCHPENIIILFLDSDSMLRKINDVIKGKNNNKNNEIYWFKIRGNDKFWSSFANMRITSSRWDTLWSYRLWNALCIEWLLKGGDCNSRAMSAQCNGMMKTATKGWQTIDFKKEMKIDFPIYYYSRNFKIYSSWQCT